jgi:GT2 family glycosyltransferase
VKPDISVVIPTAGRPELLRAALESLTTQTLPRERFEVVVVQDGDGSDWAWRELDRELVLTTHQIESSGISAAKNLGLFAARAPIVFFFDDDDVAHEDLLAQHLAAHEAQPNENLAVLGHTGWAAGLEVTEVMRFITDAGLLFSYGQLPVDAPLDYRAFWGGRSSCKRMFLAQHGIFDTSFTFGCEDIELGYRLSRYGMHVKYHPAARSFMNRAVTFAEFCLRSERQGRAQHRFGRVLHPVPEIETYTCVRGAEERWRAVEPLLAAMMREVADLERVVGRTSDSAARVRLHQLYAACFAAHRDKGIAEAADDVAGCLVGA